MWYQTECALAYKSMNKFGDALKKCHEIERVRFLTWGGEGTYYYYFILFFFIMKVISKLDFLPLKMCSNKKSEIKKSNVVPVFRDGHADSLRVKPV